MKAQQDNEIIITKCNPLYFPSGNENGEHWEEYYCAEIDGLKAYGATPEAAQAAIQTARGGGNDSRQ